VTSLLAFDAAQKGLTLMADAPPELAGLALVGDPLRLGQILLNLTSNAIKFTAQGTISIQLSRLEDTPDDILLRFKVHDTGIGIPVEDQRRIFTAFEQADNSTTRTHGGTGLGLAISKRLARMMRGDIGVDSAVGQGSTFWFTARLEKGKTGPASVQTRGTSLAEERLKSRNPGARILLAEDEPISREVALALLEDVGLTVDVAVNGEKAVEQARKKDYDLILMDITMPVMDGLDATRTIRTLPGYAHTPILALTASVYNEDRDRCIAAGMNEHIGKPIDPERLFAVLLAWLPEPATL
jgi:hypothetical protein